MANLKALLEHEASAEITAIISEAQDRASEIVAKAKEQAETFLAQQQRTLDSRFDAEIVRIKSSAQLEAAAQKLRAQNDAVEGIFGRVKGEIDALIRDPDRYGGVLEKLLTEAKDGIGGNVSQIFANSSDVGLVQAVAQKLGLEAQVEADDSVYGGVKVKADGKSTSITNSLLDRLDVLRASLGAEVSKLLFSEGA